MYSLHWSMTNCQIWGMVMVMPQIFTKAFNGNERSQKLPKGTIDSFRCLLSSVSGLRWTTVKKSHPFHLYLTFTESGETEI